MALGVTDPPVIALMCLGLAWTAGPLLRQEGTAATQAGDAAALSSAGAVWKRPGRPLYAGVAIGMGCALKATAWPALPVIFALVALGDGRRAATRFAGAALGSFVVLTAVMAPALLTRAGALWQNIVAYPLGFSRGRTPAASPLPGHLLASAGAAGHVAAILLLGVAAIAMGVSLVIRPPRGLPQTAVRLAVGLTLMFLFAPDARFGYFAYPLGIVLFLFVAVASPRREILGEARADRTPVGPPLSFAPDCAAPVRSYRDRGGQPS
jgi:hypothetical protein